MANLKDEAMKAGRQISVVRLMPKPPSLTGREAWLKVNNYYYYFIIIIIKLLLLLLSLSWLLLLFTFLYIALLL